MINLCDSTDDDDDVRGGSAPSEVRSAGAGGSSGASTSAVAIDLTEGYGSSSVSKDNTSFDDPSVYDLMQLGFSAEQAKRALQVADGNKEVAAQYLLDDTVDSRIQEEQSRRKKRRRGGHGSATYPHAPMSFLLDDENFYQACLDAHRHERGVSAEAVLESVKRLAKGKPEFIQLMAANPDSVINLIANFDA